MHQQRLGRAADSGAPHLGVDDDPQRLVEIGRPIDVDVHDAFEMGEHRHARLALNPLDQAFSPARHDDVERAAEALEHLADRLPRGEGRARNRSLGQTGFLQARDQAALDGGRRANTIRAAAQHHSVAALEAERAGVGGHIGPALVDHADDAERRRHALDHEAVGAGEGREHPPDRIGQGRRPPRARAQFPRSGPDRASAGRSTPRSSPWLEPRRNRAHWRLESRPPVRAGFAPRREARGSSSPPAHWRSHARRRAPSPRLRALRRGHRFPARRSEQPT